MLDAPEAARAPLWANRSCRIPPLAPPVFRKGYSRCRAILSSIPAQAQRRRNEPCCGRPEGALRTAVVSRAELPRTAGNAPARKKKRPRS